MKKEQPKKRSKKLSTQNSPTEEIVDRRDPKHKLASILNRNFNFSLSESKVEDIFKQRYWWLNLIPQLHVGPYRIDFYSRVLNEPIEVNSMFHTIEGDYKKYKFITSKIDPFTNKLFKLPVIIMDTDLRSEKILGYWDSFFIKKVEKVLPKLLETIKNFN